MATYLTTAEAAKTARKHPVTVRKALESGELHGSQRSVGGRWTIREDCLEAFIEGRPCEHKARGKRSNVTPIAGRVAS
ncbi:helix-turn-helix domain-containing protein [Microbacterium sp. 5K110]|jgi:excisionase family DNA binding protein|uniref:helix-turn-helix domain-containing protein n=1 Tax=unclassified Microbacterium TaxID=2609290 RepID=UPI0010FD0E99|nr:helix-turn-helix domain-containing protein [Microbacterium sp. 5K110]